MTLSQPALSGALPLDAGVPGGLATTLSLGSTGGGTLAYTSPAIAADQLFDRLGIHWTEPQGLRNAVSIDVRTSADGATWSDWSAAADDDDLFDFDRNEHYAAPLPATEGARFAQYRAWLSGGDPSALARVGITFMDVSDLNEGPLVTLWNDVRGAVADLGQSYAAENPDSAAAYYRQVLERYPQSPRASAALYNVGLLAERRKDAAAAKADKRARR